MVQTYIKTLTCRVDLLHDKLYELGLDKYFELISITPTQTVIVERDPHKRVSETHIVKEVTVVYKSSYIFKQLRSELDSILSCDWGTDTFVDKFVKLRCDKKFREYSINFYMVGFWENITERLSKVSSDVDLDVQIGLRGLEDHLRHRDNLRNLGTRVGSNTTPMWNNGDVQSYVEGLIDKMISEPRATLQFEIDVRKDIEETYQQLRYILKPNEIAATLNWI